MSVGIFVFDVCVTLLLSAWLLYSYSNWFRQHLAVTVSVLIAWYFSFLIIFIIPLDVSSTAYKQCLNASADSSTETSVAVPTEPVITAADINRTKTLSAFDNTVITDQIVASALKQDNHCQPPYSLLDEHVLPDLWRIVYWSSQFLTWLILPLMQSYTAAGEFTVLGKLRSSVWDNIIYYTSYIFIAIVLIVYIATKPDLHLNWDRIKAIAAAASNTWGLFVLVLMLGYGLVEVPRNLWNRTERGYQLNRAYFKVAKLMQEKTDAEETLDDVLLSVHAISQIIGQADTRRPYVETILSKIPLEMMERIKRRRTEVAFGNDPPTEKTLIRLHRQVIRALQTHHRTEAQWSDLTHHVFELEDINRNMVSNEHVFKHTMSRPPGSLLAKTILNPTVEWYWKCLLSPLMLRGAAACAAIMSVLIIWSEVTFFSIHPPLSMFALFVDLAKKRYNYFAIEAICLVTICYLCLCTYYTVFKIRVLNYYYLASNHQSDEYTLLFSGALLCRLTPPLCLNFLSLIHMDSHVIQSPVMETAYTRVMGHMDVISIVSDYFNIYFPIALLALTIATYFSVGARLLSALGFQQFLTSDNELTVELVEEGKEHIKREKRRRQRLTESAMRRRDFADRFGDLERGSGAVGTSEEQPRLRGTDIIKSRTDPNAVVSSPERSLLSNQNPNYMSDRIDIDNLDLTPTHESMRQEPPRNIFDDM